MALAKSKLAIIHVAKVQLRFSEEDYRAVLLRIGGVTSSRQLDGTGFEAVMDYFRRLGFESTSPRRPLDRREGMATPGQVQMIRHLWGEFTGGKGTDRSLGKWLESHFKISSVRFLPAETVPKVIGGLRAMVAKRVAKNDAPTAA